MEATMTTTRTTTMKALVQDGTGTADVLQFRDVEMPTIGDNGVLVRVRAASVNAADYHSVHMGGFFISVIGKLMRQSGPTIPIRGIDVAGTVERVGKDVTTLRPGDDVFGVGRSTWAEYAAATERGLLPKPARLSFVEAGAVGVAAFTALQGLRDHGGLRPGQRALIYGAGGGVGTYAVQIAKALGAHVTAVTSTRNLELVAPLGADVVVDYTKEDVKKRRERYDVILDVGAIRSIGYLRSMLAPGGTLVLAGAAKKGGTFGLMSRLVAGMVRKRVFKQRTVFYIAKTKAVDLAFLRELLDSGKIRPVIDRTYPFAEAREAVRYAMSGQGRAKVVIEVA